MNRRLARFGLDIELPLEANRLLEIHRHVQEVREMFALALHVGVEQRGVALTAAPEDIALATESMRDFDGLLYLRRRVREHIKPRTRRRTRDVARMREQARGAPQKFLATCAREDCEVIDDAIKIRVGFSERGAFGRDVAIVKAVVIDAALAQKFEERIGAAQAVVNVITAIVPRHARGGASKWICESVAHGVPVARRKAQVIMHGLAFDEIVGAIVAEAQRSLGIALNEGNSFDADKRFL